MRPGDSDGDGRAGILVAEVAWPVVELRLRAGATAVLPIGAASKQHGHHLPMGTDCIQAEWVARSLAAHADVVIWPTLGYGYYPVFVDYPGSISLVRGTFVAVVREIVEGIFLAGARHVAVLNTGISTLEPLQAVVEALPRPQAATVINVYDGPRFAAATAAVEEQPFGGHADEIETSIMLVLAPERVDMSRAAPALTRIRRGLYNRRDPAAPNYSPSGVNGDPTLATAVKGRRLAQALLDDVLGRIAQIRR